MFGPSLTPLDHLSLLRHLGSGCNQHGRQLPILVIDGEDAFPERLLFTAKGVMYSAPSQLIGHRLMVRVYTQHIECWLGGQRVLERTRGTHGAGQRHPREIDYRHLVAALKRKPGAFARWVLRDAAFPREVYRRTWERLAAAVPERQACKTMVGLLSLAADGHEAQLADELEQLIELDQLPDLLALEALLAPPRAEVPAVAVELPPLHGYDELIGGADVELAADTDEVAA
jgi:hypothetical protein